MIVERTLAARAVGWSWELRPNRSASLRGLYGFFALMVATSLAVSGYSFSQGNAFAPLFAVLELALLAVCLRLVWRGLAARERLELTEQAMLSDPASAAAQSARLTQIASGNSFGSIVMASSSAWATHAIISCEGNGQGWLAT